MFTKVKYEQIQNMSPESSQPTHKHIILEYKNYIFAARNLRIKAKE